VLKKHYKKIATVLFVVAALIAVRIYQAPVKSGAVLNAFDFATSTPAKLKLIFFDVGQGDASLIITPHGEDVLIDGGPNNTVVQKLGEYLPYTDRKIEYIILTHPHADHLDGLLETLNRYEVGEVIMTGVAYGTADYEKFRQEIERKNIQIKLIEWPQKILIDGITLNMLTPENFLNNKTIENLNNSSIVFRLEYVSTTALFMGDYENEESFLTGTSTPLKSDILKTGHHGSTNANDRKFLASVAPKYAVISVGAKNSYGLPDYRTIFYLKQLDSQVLRTDESGDIGFASDGNNLGLVK